MHKQKITSDFNGLYKLLWELKNNNNEFFLANSRNASSSKNSQTVLKEEQEFPIIKIPNWKEIPINSYRNNKGANS